MWNSLPAWVVSARNTNIFKNRLDQYWQHKNIVRDFQAQIQGTGNRSDFLKCKLYGNIQL